MSEIENLEREIRAVLVLLLLGCVEGEGGGKCWQFLVLAMHYTRYDSSVAIHEMAWPWHYGSI